MKAPRSMSSRPFSAVVLLVGFLTGAVVAEAERPELLPMPEPVVERMEEIVRQQLRDARERLDAVLADEQAPTERLLASLAALGRLYLSYHLTDAAEAVFQNAARLAPDDGRWPYYLGVLYQNQRRLDDAVKALKRVLELDPQYGPALVRLARVRRLQGRDDLAEPLFRRALERQNLAAAAHDGLGQIALDRGELTAAIEHFRETLSLQPEAAAVHQKLGLAYRQSGDLERAREHLRQSGQAQVRFADPLIQSLVAEGALAHMLHGIVAYRKGDYETALERHRHALELDDDNPTIRRELALTLRRLGRHDDAIAEFRAALELDPQSPRAHYELGDALAERVADQDEAIAELRRALELEPRLLAAHLALGRVLQERGDLEAAAEAYERALAVAPDDPRVRRGRALAISRLGRPEEGLRQLEELFAAAPDDFDIALDLAALAAQAGHRGRAIEVLRRARELAAEAPRRALLSFNLANLLQEEGDVAAAVAEYRAALEREPDLRDAHFNLALLFLKEARYADAVPHLSRVVELAPGDEPARYLYATALLFTGRDAEARGVLEAGLGEDGPSLRLKHLLVRLLATSQDPGVRDGQRAATLAQEVFAAEQSAEHAETVALALAAAGQLDDAVRWQSQLLAQAEKANAPDGMLRRLRDNLERFRAGQGGRRPWPEIEKGS